MSRFGDRIVVALRRGLARADTWIAALGFFYSGRSAGDGRAVWAALSGAIGVVFLVASGDYAWRKGFVAGKREGGSTK